MNGVLAQLIAITSYGNEFLRNGNIEADFLLTNDVFKFCKSINFIIFEKKLFFRGKKEKTIATTPIEWFRYLNNDGCSRLRLYFQYSDQKDAKDYKLAGFVGGGGSWLIESVNGNHSDFWQSRWEVNREDESDENRWLVSYGEVLKNHSSIESKYDLGLQKEKLDTILTEIKDFANKNCLEFWGEWFNKAQLNLNSSNPGAEHYDKMIVGKNYSLVAKQLLFGATGSYVFGGMGSWNDNGFNDKITNEQYNELSERLFDNVNKSIIASINSF